MATHIKGKVGRPIHLDIGPPDAEVTVTEKTMSVKKEKVTIVGDEETRVTETSPQFIQPLFPAAQAAVGQNVTLECRLDGNPEPTLVWTHNGQLVQSSQRRDIRFVSGLVTLTVYGVAQADSGEYICRATNTLGETATKTNLSIGGKGADGFAMMAPGPPHQLAQNGTIVPQMGSTAASGSRRGRAEVQLTPLTTAATGGGDAVAIPHMPLGASINLQFDVQGQGGMTGAIYQGQSQVSHQTSSSSSAQQHSSRISQFQQQQHVTTQQQQQRITSQSMQQQQQQQHINISQQQQQQDAHAQRASASLTEFKTRRTGSGGTPSTLPQVGQPGRTMSGGALPQVGGQQRYQSPSPAGRGYTPPAASLPYGHHQHMPQVRAASVPRHIGSTVQQQQHVTQQQQYGSTASSSTYGDVLQQQLLRGQSPGQGALSPGRGPISPGRGQAMMSPGRGPMSPGRGPMSPGQGQFVQQPGPPSKVPKMQSGAFVLPQAGASQRPTSQPPMQRHMMSTQMNVAQRPSSQPPPMVRSTATMQQSHQTMQQSHQTMQQSQQHVSMQQQSQQHISMQQSQQHVSQQAVHMKSQQAMNIKQTQISPKQISPGFSPKQPISPAFSPGQQMSPGMRQTHGDILQQHMTQTHGEMTRQQQHTSQSTFKTSSEMTQQQYETAQSTLRASLAPPQPQTFRSQRSITPIRSGQASPQRRRSITPVRTAPSSGRSTPSGQEAPKFTTPLRDMNVNDGERCVFKVVYRGNPRPTLHWLFNSEPITPSDDFQIRVDVNRCESTLTIKEVFPDDEGEYMVKAESALGSAVTHCHLFVRIPSSSEEDVPKLVAQSKETRTTQDTMQLKERSSFSETISIETQKRFKECQVEFGITEKVRPAHSEIQTQASNGALQSLRMDVDVQLPQTATTIAEAKNILLQKSIDVSSSMSRVDQQKLQQQHAYLSRPLAEQRRFSETITVPSKKQPHPEAQDVVFSLPEQRRRLEKSAIQINQQTALRGVKMEVEIDTSQQQKIQTQTARVDLRAKKVSVVATPSQRQEMTVKLDQGSPPGFTKELQSFKIMDGEEVKFHCVVTGKPMPEITWYKNGKVIVENPDFNMSYDRTTGVCTLNIIEVFPQDTGEYRCTAINNYGRAVSIARLTVEVFEYVQDSEEASCSAAESLPDRVADEDEAIFLERTQAFIANMQKLRQELAEEKVQEDIVMEDEQYNEETVQIADVRWAKRSVEQTLAPVSPDTTMEFSTSIQEQSLQQQTVSVQQQQAIVQSRRETKATEVVSMVTPEHVVEQAPTASPQQPTQQAVTVNLVSAQPQSAQPSHVAPRMEVVTPGEVDRLDGVPTPDAAAVQHVQTQMQTSVQVQQKTAKHVSQSTEVFAQEMTQERMEVIPTPEGAAEQQVTVQMQTIQQQQIRQRPQKQAMPQEAVLLLEGVQETSERFPTPEEAGMNMASVQMQQIKPHTPTGAMVAPSEQQMPLETIQAMETRMPTPDDGVMSQQEKVMLTPVQVRKAPLKHVGVTEARYSPEEEDDLFHDVQEPGLESHTVMVERHAVQFVERPLKLVETQQAFIEYTETGMSTAEFEEAVPLEGKVESTLAKAKRTPAKGALAKVQEQKMVAGKAEAFTPEKVKSETTAPLEVKTSTAPATLEWFRLEIHVAAQGVEITEDENIFDTCTVETMQSDMQTLQQQTELTQAVKMATLSVASGQTLELHTEAAEEINTEFRVTSAPGSVQEGVEFHRPEMTEQVVRAYHEVIETIEQVTETETEEIEVVGKTAPPIAKSETPEEIIGMEEIEVVERRIAYEIHKDMTQQEMEMQGHVQMEIHYPEQETKQTVVKKQAVANKQQVTVQQKQGVKVLKKPEVVKKPDTPEEIIETGDSWEVVEKISYDITKDVEQRDITQTQTVTMMQTLPKQVTTTTQQQVINQQMQVQQQQDAHMLVTKVSPVSMMAPVFEIPLADSTVSDGERAVLECKVAGMPRPIISWYFNGVEVKPSPDFCVDYTEEGYVTLTICDVLPEDEGEHTLKAVNEAGDCTTTAYLTVLPAEHSEPHSPEVERAVNQQETVVSESSQKTEVDIIMQTHKKGVLIQQQVEVPVPAQPDAPRFLVMLEHKEVFETMSVTLQCRVTGNPEPDITWYQNGKKIVSTKHIQLTYQSGVSTLHIERVTIDDEAEYMCEATNTYGISSTTAEVLVEKLLNEVEQVIIEELWEVEIEMFFKYRAERRLRELLLQGSRFDVVALMNSGQRGNDTTPVV